MRKTIRIWIIVLVLTVIPWTALAADAGVTMSGAASGEVGKTITVKVAYKGSSLGYVNGHLTYDNSKLQYMSGGSSQGDGGLVELKSYAGDASGKISFKVKFKLVGTGSTDLELSTLESQNLDGDQDMGTPSAKMAVKVKGSSQAATQVTTASTNQTASGESNNASQDNTISTEPGVDQSERDDAQGGMNYIVLGSIAVVLIILIAAIAVYLGKKRKK